MGRRKKRRTTKFNLMKEILATIKKGELEFADGFNGLNLWRLFKKENEGRRILISLFSGSRTGQQNRFYWMYLGLIAKETGDTENDLHDYLKRKLLPPRFTKVLGQEIKLPASTTKLNKIEMGEYLEKICALTGVPIPDPEKYLYSND